MSDLPESLNRARAAAFSDRPAWEALQNQRPPRPMPRQMRPPEQRSRDPRLAPMERQRALNQFERGNAANADTYQRQAFDQRNQVAEAGAMAVESTGLPAIRRAGSDLARWGAYSAGTEQGGEDLASGLMNAGAGGLGVLGMAGLAPRSRGALRAPQQAPEPMPRLTPPPRQIAPNGMPIRPPQPFRQSMVGGSDDLAEAAGLGGQVPGVGSAGGERTPRFSPREQGANLRTYRIPLSSGGGATLRVRRVVPGVGPHSIDLKLDGMPAGHRRQRVAFEAFRGAQEALEYDLLQHAPEGYAFTGTTSTKVGLYDSMLRRARELGYELTPASRARQALGSAIAPDAMAPMLPQGAVDAMFPGLSSDQLSDAFHTVMFGRRHLTKTGAPK